MRRECANPVLVFDTGDFLPALPDSERSEYILRAMKQAKYDAILPGDQEFLSGQSFFLHHFISSPVAPILADNLLYNNTSKRIFPTINLPIDTSWQIPVGLYAVIDPSAFLFFPEDKKGWFQVRSLKETLRERLPSAKKPTLCILLSHSGLMEDQEIAEEFPRIDVIIGGHSQSQTEQPVQVGKTLIVQTDGSGRFVGRLDLKLDKSCDITRFRYELVPMKPEIPSDSAIMNLVAEYEHAFFADKKPRPHIPVYPDTLEIRPAGFCGECHSTQYQSWLVTAHARAFDIIEQRRKIYHPGCLSCHTTGFGHRGGFISLENTPQWKHIACSECHYTPAGHSTAPSQLKPLPLSTRTCIRCHDSRNSPEFKYEDYIKQISH